MFTSNASGVLGPITHLTADLVADFVVRMLLEEPNRNSAGFYTGNMNPR